MILSVDPGQRTCGWAIVAPRTARVAALGTLVVDPDDRMRKTLDRKRRAEIQARHLRALADTYAITAIAGEAPSFGGPPAARFAMAVALCTSWGILTTLGLWFDVPVIEVPPKTWQRAIQPDAGKAVNYDRLFADLAGFVGDQATRALSDLEAIKVSMRNHALDAVGVGVYAAIELGVGQPRSEAKGAA